VKAVREARVVRLDEVEVHDRVERREDQPGEHLAAEVDDVGVEERHVIDAFLRQQQAHREPAGTALARAADVEARLLRLGEEPEHGGSSAPEDHQPARITGEEAHGALVVVAVGAIERDDDGVQVVDLAQLVEDAPDGRAVHLGGDHGKDQRHRELGSEVADVVFELLDGTVEQAGQGGDETGLVEVAHAESLTGMPRARA
jgi:hypothetical protein